MDIKPPELTSVLQGSIPSGSGGTPVQVQVLSPEYLVVKEKKQTAQSYRLFFFYVYQI